MIIAACLWYENGDLLRQIIKKLSQAKEVRGPGGTGAIFDTPEEEELKNPSISIQEFTRNDNSS